MSPNPILDVVTELGIVELRRYTWLRDRSSWCTGTCRTWGGPWARCSESQFLEEPNAMSKTRQWIRELNQAFDQNLCTAIPSPPPVLSLLAEATVYNCATWYSSTVSGSGILNSVISMMSRRCLPRLQMPLARQGGVGACVSGVCARRTVLRTRAHAQQNAFFLRVAQPNEGKEPRTCGNSESSSCRPACVATREPHGCIARNGPSMGCAAVKAVCSCARVNAGESSFHRSLITPSLVRRPRVYMEQLLVA